MPRKKSAYEKKLEYNNAYNRENYRSFSIRYDKESEKKIIKWLEKQNGVKAYVTSLIAEDMKKQADERARKRAMNAAAKSSAPTKSTKKKG